MPGKPRAATHFVILAATRSGSNLLCTLLDAHPEIVCHHEVFNPSGIFFALDFRGRTLELGTVDERDHEPLRFLERLWRHDWGVSCVGFKMTRGQDATVLAAVLEDPGIRKILLRRSNALRTYVSELIARETGRWEAYDPSELPKHRPLVRVDPEELRGHIAVNNAFYASLEEILDRSCQEYFCASFESLFSTGACRRLLDFLEVSPNVGPLVPRSVRQNPEHLQELVSNYCELQSELRGTDLAPLLETDEIFVHDEISGQA